MCPKQEETAMTNDRCVVCGKDSGVPSDTPIEKRERYILGSGQLCTDCYFELYQKPKSTMPMLSTEDGIKQLMDMSR